MEKELRRGRSTLYILGGGMILFALWIVVKPFLLVLMFTDETEAAPTEVVPAITREVALLLVAGLLLLMAAGVGLRIWMGLSARAEGLGKPRGRAYMIVGFVFFAIQLVGFVATAIQLLFYGAQTDNLPEAIASLLVDLSSMVTTGEMAFTARKVKRLEAQLRKAE